MATTSTTSPYTNPFQAESVYIFSFDPSANSSQRTATAAGTAHTIGYLPTNFVITQCWLHPLTTVAGGGTPNISVGYTGAATAFESAAGLGSAWNAGAPRVSDVAADGAVGNFVTAAAGDAILVTVTEAADSPLTSGKFLVCIKGYTTT